MNTITDKEIQSLKKAIDSIESKYFSEKESVDWFNNNMPGVGQKVDYLTQPPYPTELIDLKELYYKLINQ